MTRKQKHSRLWNPAQRTFGSSLVDSKSSWPITRTWTVETGHDRRTEVPTSKLSEFRVCCLLGAAGLGKTFELRQLAAAELREGGDVHFERLVELAQTNDSLATKLAALAAGLSETSFVYLDALDELMIPVPQAGLIVRSWIEDGLAEASPHIRISCRSAVWVSKIYAEFGRVYGTETCAVATLDPLSEEDVAAIAVAEGVEPNSFMSSIAAARVGVLARQPLTLMMLLRIHLAHGTLPHSRVEIFSEAVQLLADERAERREQSTVAGVSPGALLEAAERLACYLLLSGRDGIDQSDVAVESMLHRSELGRLQDGFPILDDRIIDAFRRSGLSEGENSLQFGFSHRQIAEYLAGRRLAKLLPHQARSLLSAPSGWRTGVAGPLREVASFAAIHSRTLAEWVTETDPEVIGLSDVADDSLRRRATLNLLEQFRRRELTDDQISYRDAIELQGFKYPNIENDLRPVLRERLPECVDVLECVIQLIESWELASMSDDLADLMLDLKAPLQARQAAGYALRRIGTREAKRRLRPLIADRPDDLNFDLKGLALHCLYPDDISVPELLAALTPSRRDSYVGAYEGFLSQLVRDGFDARGYRREGLRWATQFVKTRREFYTPTRIARAIARGAIGELEDPEIADALAGLILDAAESHANSPLGSPRHDGAEDDEDSQPPHLESCTNARRQLIAAICRQTSIRNVDNGRLWWVGRETPALLAEDDFRWLLQQAVSAERPIGERQAFAKLARMLPWRESSAHVDAWLAVRLIEPVASEFPFALFVNLDSDEARREKREYEESRRLERKPRRRRIKPSPAERVSEVLSLCEIKDHRFFVSLCRQLTLDSDSQFYGIERFIPETPGWKAADDATRCRIEQAAKRALELETEAPVTVRSESYSSVMGGYMSAIWLVQERDPGWLDGQSDAWWKRWTWYILREQHPNMCDEAQEPKTQLLRLVHRRNSKGIRDELLELAGSNLPESKSLLSDLLRSLETIEDGELDAALTESLAAGSVAADRVGEVAEFVLMRSVGNAIPACEASLTDQALAESTDRAVSAACAMLSHCVTESWSVVHEFMKRRPDLASNVLGRFAHSGLRLSGKGRSKTSSIEELNASHLVELLSMLIESFPPNDDAREGGARLYGDVDAGRDLWNRLLNHLGERGDYVAVSVLRTLERRFGNRYDWLRRPRSRAERAYRQKNWSPVATEAVAELLALNGKRLIRNASDAMDGIMAALEAYGDRLRHDRLNDLEDFWNERFPKSEERVSEKICDAIQSYFENHAVVANREVKVFRRKLPRSAKGAPSSLVDVHFTVPACGTATDVAIQIPIEVKLSHNSEARTNLQTQLCERYVSESGAEAGVYVVAWMGTVSRKRACWPSLAAARDDISAQAADASQEGVDIRSYVIDLSLPLSKAQKSAKKASTKKTPTKKAAKGTKSASKKSKSKAAAKSTRKPSKKPSSKGRRTGNIAQKAPRKKRG